MTELASAILKVCALLQRLEDHGLLEERKWLVSEEPLSPWICVNAVAAEPFDDDRVPALRFAIWRRTAALYVVGPDGAVSDDPISLGDVDLDDILP